MSSAAGLCWLAMVLLCSRSSGMPTRWLLFTQTATGSTVLCLLDHYHQIYCARPPSSLSSGGRWLRRWISCMWRSLGRCFAEWSPLQPASCLATARTSRATTGVPGRPLDDHSSVESLRVCSRARWHAGRIARRDRLGCASGGPTNATSSRLSAHALSPPLSTIT